MKLSFPLSSKPSSSTPTEKPKPPITFTDEDEEENSNSPTHSPPSFITEFNPSQTSTQQPHLIIPPIPNTWQPHNLNFNFQSLSTSPTTSYGLNLRPNKEFDANTNPNIDTENGSDPNQSLEWKLLQKLREDIKNLPDDKGLEEFVDVPVKGYGKAVLAGYGWVEGKGIGKNAKEDVKIVQYKPKTDTQGLGFVPKKD